ncbi:hypothetical protein [Paracoccus sanguinis]|uniref:hypothetical protein n=1 Tax=Paracoccus sanguinis TaxID=1545044 RepID=UPI0018CCDC7F|nr:hypothetical protein [Paracoccus sanguinis]
MRLFLSADLVGSTAFKGESKFSSSGETDPFPRWVAPFRTFYQEFPRFLDKSYKDCCRQDYEKLEPSRPKLWKTIGDEIIFCTRVLNLEHLAYSISAFVEALDAYSEKLEKDAFPLRLKGAGWLAAFPSPNVTIKVNRAQPIDSTQPDNEDDLEAIEKGADEHPHEYDFLGKGIDTGFRIAKNSSEDRFTVTVQLAFCLTEASKERRFPHKITFHGSEVLKGVIDGKPYPILSVDTERNREERELRRREADLTGKGDQSEFAICDYLLLFMKSRNIDIPTLWFDERPSPHAPNPPASYKSFSQQYAALAKDDAQTEREFSIATDPPKPREDALRSSSEFLKNYRELQERVMRSRLTGPDHIRIIRDNAKPSSTKKSKKKDD